MYIYGEKKTDKRDFLVTQTLKKATEFGVRKRVTHDSTHELLINDDQYQKIAQFIADNVERNFEADEVVREFVRRSNCKIDEQGKEVFFTLSRLSNNFIYDKEEEEFLNTSAIFRDVAIRNNWILEA